MTGDKSTAYRAFETQVADEQDWLCCEWVEKRLTLKRHCKPEGLALQGILMIASLILNYMSTF
jgi:hypothetical protein